jgi:hypothetical protein
MSQKTCIVFFTTSKLLDARGVLQEVLNLIKMFYHDVTRYQESDQSWRFRHKVDYALEHDFLSIRTNQCDIVGLYQEGKLLAVRGVSKLELDVQCSIEEFVQPEIYGDTLPQNTSVRIGRHDIFEDVEVDKGYAQDKNWRVSFNSLRCEAF